MDRLIETRTIYLKIKLFFLIINVFNAGGDMTGMYLFPQSYLPTASGSVESFPVLLLA